MADIDVPAVFGTLPSAQGSAGVSCGRLQCRKHKTVTILKIVVLKIVSIWPIVGKYVSMFVKLCFCKDQIKENRSGKYLGG